MTGVMAVSYPRRARYYKWSLLSDFGESTACGLREQVYKFFTTLEHFVTDSTIAWYIYLLVHGNRLTSSINIMEIVMRTQMVFCIHTESLRSEKTTDDVR